MFRRKCLVSFRISMVVFDIGNILSNWFIMTNSGIFVSTIYNWSGDSFRRNSLSPMDAMEIPMNVAYIPPVFYVHKCRAVFIFKPTQFIVFTIKWFMFTIKWFSSILACVTRYLLLVKYKREEYKNKLI
uniref:Uncharacterized protein n=2 Tax=Cacopsylla melanoneura TaxID=428564 RepID=A0A8D8TDX1_9HEMI